MPKAPRERTYFALQESLGRLLRDPKIGHSILAINKVFFIFLLSFVSFLSAEKKIRAGGYGWK